MSVQQSASPQLSTPSSLTTTWTSLLSWKHGSHLMLHRPSRRTLRRPSSLWLHVHHKSLPRGPTCGDDLAVIHRDSFIVQISTLQGNIRPPSSFVVNIYHPPTQPLGTGFFDELANLLSNVLAKTSKHLLMTGDLNCLEADSALMISLHPSSKFSDLCNWSENRCEVQSPGYCHVKGDSFIENMCWWRMVLTQLNLGWRHRKPVTFSFHCQYNKLSIVRKQLKVRKRTSLLYVNPTANVDSYTDQMVNVLNTATGHFSQNSH